jgi:predicted PurR-regulated permease PerM
MLQSLEAPHDLVAEPLTFWRIVHETCARGSAMTIQRQIGFWVIALAAATLFLFVLRDILLPFVAGFALAYLLDPLADRLEKIGIGRLGATLIILILFVLIFIVALVLLIPLVAHQLAAFIERLPAYVARLQELAVQEGGSLVEQLGGPEALPDLQRSVGNLVGQGAAWFGGFLQSLWSGGQALLSVFALLVVTPVVAFYLLVDWDQMVETVDSWLPVRHRDTIRMIASDIDLAIAGFVRGQAAVCLLLGTFYAIGLSLIGLNFGTLIGMAAGLLSFIPYVGSLTGLLLSVGVAIVQFWPDWTWIVATLAVFVFGQFVEGNILSPKLVGASVGLHPVWLMFALLAFGTLFGFVGLLLAVPLAAAMGVIVRYALKSYMASPLYHGGPVVKPPGPDNDA